MITYLLCGALVILSAWTVNVLAAGRVLPWQATTLWAGSYASAALLLCLCYLPAGRLLGRGTSSPGRRAASLWAFGPAIAVALVGLAVTYASDASYGYLVEPSRRMQMVALSIAAFVSLASSGYAAAIWATGGKSAGLEAVRTALNSNMDGVLIASLLAIGTLEAAAMSTPIGDDIGKYTEAALAMLDRQPYPVHQAAGYLVEAGMTGNSPALPALPVLLAAGFAAFGRNFAGLAIPLAALAAVFPIAMYLACLAFTRARTPSYIGAVLTSMFPIYQLHILGTAVPDTLFAVSMLLAAAAAAKAISKPEPGWWALAGAAIALVANSRPEGLNFSLVMLLATALCYWRSRAYWFAVLAYLLLMAPFAITYQSAAGTPWPTTFGGTVGPRYVQANLSNLYEFVLPWYEQATGLGRGGLAALVVVAALAGLTALRLLWADRPALLFVPLLGFGYILASLMIHPLILMSYTPVDVLRHWNSGVPYVALTLTYTGTVVARRIGRASTPPVRLGLVLAVVLLAASFTYYESERLAKPEWHFGGSWSLLWTGTGYLLSDVLRDPIQIPSRDDRRTGEEMRKEQASRLEPYDLHRTNAAEPYHWTALIVSVFGLLYAAAPLILESAIEARDSRIRASAASEPSR